MATTKATTLAHTIASTTSSTADLDYAKTLNDTGVTSTEFDKLDGLTATTTELNKLSGVTATTDELNLVDGSVSGPLSHRNFIINGAMQVAQRGASVTTANGYTLDRWRIEPINTTYTAGIAGTVAQVDDNGYAMSVQSSTTAPGFFMIEQRLEGKDVAHLSGKTVTFSFKIKRVNGSISSGSIRVNHDDDLSGSLRDESTIATVESDVSTISTSAYEQYSTSYTFPSTVSTTGYYRIGIYFHSLGGAPTSSELFRIKEVQLEEGSIATPFEYRSYVDELARCQRYYYKWVTENAGGIGGVVIDNTGSAWNIIFPVTMRTDPGVTELISGVTMQIGTFDGSNSSTGSFTVYPSQEGCLAQYTHGINYNNTTVGRPCKFNNDGDKLEFDAEL